MTPGRLWITKVISYWDGPLEFYGVLDDTFTSGDVGNVV